MILTKRFIIDTNSLISGLLIKNSTTFKAMEKARTTGELLFSEETFLEFELVLLRRKFDRYFLNDERLQIIERFYREANFVTVNSNLTACRDPKDDKFLNLAIDANVDCIITGDDDLLVLHPFRGIPILSPADFFNLN